MRIDQMDERPSCGCHDPLATGEDTLNLRLRRLLDLP